MLGIVPQDAEWFEAKQSRRNGDGRGGRQAGPGQAPPPPAPAEPEDGFEVRIIWLSAAAINAIRTFGGKSNVLQLARAGCYISNLCCVFWLALVLPARWLSQLPQRLLL